MLKGKTAMVTGGTRGIGRAIALQLAAAGAEVLITYNQSADRAVAVVREIEATGQRAHAFHADAGQPETMHDLIKKVTQRFKTIDILVHNAGVFEGGVIGQTAYADFFRTMQINVHSIHALTAAALPYIPDGGRIIMIGSVLGERAAVAGLSAYNSSKFAVAGLGRSYAKDLGARGILVNVVQPGPINTEMNPDSGEGAGAMKSMTALGRYGKPDEVAALVKFLAGPEASYITGATLNVDGGWNA